MTKILVGDIPYIIYYTFNLISRAVAKCANKSQYFSTFVLWKWPEKLKSDKSVI